MAGELTISVQDHGGPNASLRETTFDGDIIYGEIRAGSEVAYLQARHKARTHCERAGIFHRKLRQFDDPLDKYIAEVAVSEEAHARYEKKNPNGPVVNISSFGNLKKLQKLTPEKCPCYGLPTYPKQVEMDVYGQKSFGGFWHDARLRHFGAEGKIFNPDEHAILEASFPPSWKEAVKQALHEGSKVGSEMESARSREWFDKRHELKKEYKKHPFNLQTYRENVLLMLKQAGVKGTQQWFTERGFQMTLEQAQVWYSEHFR